jgi:hypothetical protein
MRRKNFLTLGSLWGVNLPLAFININQMAHTLIITAFQPDFTPSFKAWIKKNISPSMVNPNDEECSYNLDTILDETPAISEEDSLLIAELQSQNVEYVEF